MINVLIIDDSAFMRKALQIMLESDPGIQVIGSARDGEEGFQKVKALVPDVVTLDLEMPRTNGLQCLDLIMKNCPTPVLVVSSASTEGADITLDALERGAVDFIPKTQSFVAIDITKIKVDLIEKVKVVSKHKSLNSKVRQRVMEQQKSMKGRFRPSLKKAPKKAVDLSNVNIDCIAMGVSTGGPPVVQSILSSLPMDFPVPIIIAQHMPKEFTASFAARLDGLSKITVVEAKTGDPLEKGHAYVGQGGKHLFVEKQGKNVFTKLSEEPSDLLYFPSVDVLVASATLTFGSKTLGVQLTGMGKDGLIGLKELHSLGGKIICQNEKSCVVYGMPKAVVDEGIASEVLSVEGIAEAINTVKG